MKKDEIINLIIKSFYENNNSHAFLFSTNNVDLCYKDVLTIVKKINCSNHGDDDCNICRTIDEETNPDVIVIKPEGKEIKKDQILNMVNSFSTKPSISKYSTYIVYNAEVMNNFSANKILKFLEEPDGPIIGFFITNKPNSIIPTIKSRCEIYDLHYGSDSLLDILDITEDEYASSFNDALKITTLLNSNIKYKLMPESKNLAKKERYELDLLFNLIKKFYIIKYENVEYCTYNDLDFISPIFEAIETNDLSIIVKRIKILDNICNALNVYVNKELIINKFFVIWE